MPVKSMSVEGLQSVFISVLHLQAETFKKVVREGKVKEIYKYVF